MNIILILSAIILCFFLACRFYARYISKAMGLDQRRITPALEKNDGRDYVPTRTPVVFAHHFASIAGAGPIIGPTIALIYGWGPAWLWVVIGGIFFGAVHDFSAIFISVREGGKSIAEIARKTLGKNGFIMMIAFAIIMLVLVNATFLNASVTALTSMVEPAQLNLSGEQNIFREIGEGANRKILIGGIASASVVVITLFAPLLGFLYLKRNIPIILCSFFAIIICTFSVAMGIYRPITLSPLIWMLSISIYTWIAAGIPVWIFLQSRDFINVHILYAGIVILVVGIFSYGFKGAQINFPVTNVAEGVSNIGYIWPAIFITIACGAISGFHSLCGTGTTSKQLKSEHATRQVGFYGMLLESFLAACVIAVLVIGIDFSHYKQLVFPDIGSGQKGNPILAFSLALGHTLGHGFGLPVAFGTIFGMLLLEGFIVTSLDTAVRLNRYLFEELWHVIFSKPPAFLRYYMFNSGLAVVLMFCLARNNTVATIWSIFGAANQLLAALSLLAVSFWLLNNGRRAWYTIIPACFMLVTTISMLVILLTTNYLPKGNYPLIVASALLLCLAVGIIGAAIKVYGRYLKDSTANVPEALAEKAS
ncbi:MAG TPA: carbon starvation CstA family protein [Candidatus Brocadiales bacterium]|nr:carbon starvation CstA family protein [Candidatus Brocadiales bacterium]